MCGSLLFKKVKRGGGGSLPFKRDKMVRRIIRGGCDPCPLRGVKGLTHRERWARRPFKTSTERKFKVAQMCFEYLSNQQKSIQGVIFEFKVVKKI